MWLVAAYKGNSLEYVVSISYKNKCDAEAYCEKCMAECSDTTGLSYKVIEEADEEDIYD